MNGVMLAIGDFQFSMDSTHYQELEKRHAWRWSSYERVNQKTASQFQGADATEITIAGVKYIESKADIDHINILKAQGDKGQPLRLVSGSKAVGRDWGLWAMLAMTEKNRHSLPDGTPLKIEFTVRLKEHG